MPFVAHQLRLPTSCSAQIKLARKSWHNVPAGVARSVTAGSVWQERTQRIRAQCAAKPLR
ncbi:hypothetical protein [Fibrella forsythiae]|uniref:Uncharacterized protein n=1 Tax=Fibrella forsythiae TaxID=2817061 RepID=A0ABS3JEG2_9BACT|nr:hypothetical protein [Fibrella forsythiae]MBO0947836.1 hypothetical protein [Fibrella forsythiae]